MSDQPEPDPAPEPQRNLGELLMHYAEERGLSRGQIEARTRIPRSTLSRWMRDEVDTVAMLWVRTEALCAVLGCTLDEIVGASLVSMEQKARE